MPPGNKPLLHQCWLTSTFDEYIISTTVWLRLNVHFELWTRENMAFTVKAACVFLRSSPQCLCKSKKNGSLSSQYTHWGLSTYYCILLNILVARVLGWYPTFYWQSSRRQYYKVGKRFQYSKDSGEGAVVGKSPVSGLAPRWIEEWLLPGLMSKKK